MWSQVSSLLICLRAVLNSAVSTNVKGSLHYAEAKRLLEVSQRRLPDAVSRVHRVFLVGMADYGVSAYPIISLQDFAACSSAQLTPSRAVLGPLTSTGNESGCARTECYQNQREKLRRQKQLTQYLPTQRKVTLHGVGWFPDAVIPAASDSTAANSATVAQVDVCNVPISCDINATSGAIYHQQYRAMRKRQGAPAHRHA